MFSTTPLNREKNKVTEAIRRTKKTLFYESFRENRDDSKKIWFALKDLTGQKNHGGVSYLEENRSIYKYAMKLRETAMAATPSGSNNSL